MKPQSKLMSLAEALTNTVVGFLLRRLFNAQWRPRLQAWWICKRPAVVQFLDRMADAYGKYGRGRPFR
jgi:hypothetical protein